MEGFYQLNESFHLTILQFARWRVDLAMLTRRLIEKNKSAKLPFPAAVVNTFTLRLRSGRGGDIHVLFTGKSSFGLNISQLSQREPVLQIII